MPSPFDITVASNTVNLDNKREGIATFTAKNTTRRRIRATAKLTVTPADGAGWLTILPPETTGTDTADVRDFPIDSTQQYQVKIVVPPAAAPGSYTMKLTLADEVNPDENFTDSQEVVFTVREIPKPEPRKFPVWIIPAVIIAILVIGAIVVIGINSANNANANATATATAALQLTRAAADTQTAVALGGTAVAQTQAAIGTQNAAATQTALNVFIGTWRPINPGVIEEMGISSTGNNQLSVSYTSRCPPNQNLCLLFSQTFTFTNVPFSPTQLAAGGSAVQLLIVPANNNQLSVTINASGDFSLQTFTRRRLIDDLILDTDISIITRPFPLFSVIPFNEAQLAITQESP
jgi:hypothetical protein